MLFSQDTFTDTSGTALDAHTGEIGASWAVHASALGVMEITNANRLYVLAGNTNTARYYASGVPASPDYDVEVDLVMLASNATGTSAEAWGVLGRVDTAANNRYEAHYLMPDAIWQLRKSVAGTGSTLGTPYSQVLSANTTYRLKLQMRGTTLKLFVDGVERCSATDSDFSAAGRAGLVGLDGFESSYSIGPHFDNFAATDAASGRKFLLVRR